MINWYDYSYLLLLIVKLMITEITEIQALGQAGEKSPKTQSVVLPNNVRIEADDVRIAYSQLTIGRALGNGKPHQLSLNLCRC